MKTDATLHFVTIARERTEFTTRGYVEKLDGEVRFGYAEDGYTVTGKLVGDTLTVERSESDGYEMVFESGRMHEVNFGGVTAELYTDKLLSSVKENKLHISVSYVLGGVQMQMILHAEY